MATSQCILMNVVNDMFWVNERQCICNIEGIDGFEQHNSADFPTNAKWRVDSRQTPDRHR